MADYTVNDSSLTAVADAIREKSGSSKELVFPDGFVSGVKSISGGGDTFWDVYQQNGERTSYLYGFASWPGSAIKPKYDVIVTNANSMFSQSGTIDGADISLPDIAQECGITFDFSRSTNFMNFSSWSTVVDLGFVDTRGCTNMGSGFSNSSSLKRLSLALKEDGSQDFSGAFAYTSGLADLSVTSGYFGSNLSFAQSSKLTNASVQSIIDHLKDLTGATAKTITLHSTVGGKLTATQKSAISAKNWTLAY